MVENAVTRRLSAIVALDVVGYSRLMGADEAGTLARLKQRRQATDEISARHGGRIVGTAGDGILLEFPSIIEAVSFAIETQELMAKCNADLPDQEQMLYRIGVNLGDVLVDGADIYGDGVNVAARLEALAEPGGICISGAVSDHVRDRLPIVLQDRGEIELKNIAQPVRVFQVLSDPEAVASARRRVRATSRWKLPAALAVAILVLAGSALLAWLEPWRAPTPPPGSSLSAGTSIAVLPFANLSQEPDQEYFADGMTNDLITDLSKFEDLRVIASNSVFAYKGKAMTIQAVGKALGVRYVLEGSVQKLGDRVRINAQLIDAANAQHLWAERYEEKVTNLFELQDRITQTIVRTLSVKLTRLEQERAASKPTEDMQAYDYVLRGRELLTDVSRAKNFEARDLFQKAIDRDPGYGAAYAGLGAAYKAAVLYGWTETPQKALQRAYDLGQKAVSADEASVEGHNLLATVYLLRRQYDLALAESKRAIAINPNNAASHANQGDILVWSGQPKDAIRALETALRFDPLMATGPLTELGVAYYLTGRYGDAATVLERGVGQNPKYAYGQLMLAATYGQLGRKDEASRAAQAVRRLDPFFSTEHFGYLFRNPADAAAIIDGLHKAGLK